MLTTKNACEILHEQGLLNATDVEINVKEQSEKERWENNVAAEEAEWSSLEILKHPISGVVKAVEDITFNEALQHFQTCDWHCLNATRKSKRSKLSLFIRFLFGPRPLVKSLQEERDMIFHIAQVAMNNNEPVHCRVLQTIYKHLTGLKHSCPRFGQHWEIIGFQGNDPATDLRGAGFLALLHLLYLVMEHRALCGEIYKLSTHYEQNFPFALVSINVTRIALQALREEKLSSICNKRKQVVAVMNEFHLAVFRHFFYIWKTQHKTMKDSGHVMKDVERSALKEPNAMLKNLHSFLTKQTYSRAAPPTIDLSRLSTASSASDLSLQSPALTSHSLEVVLQPVSRVRGQSESSDPRFAGVYELTEDNVQEFDKKNDEMTSHL
uniref:ELMO domain-containing protein 3 n=1 Tax=Phallusia mammillata TaxID=59560 RepID=A0A6F9DCI5_9ASCI|nr:ELMO domain-containing protein 3 [Phallusia mammillata]